MKIKFYAIVLIILMVYLLAACNSETMNLAEETSSGVLESSVASINKYIESSGQYDLPENFQDTAFEHIKKLSSFGMRYANSESEEQTVDYIYKCFQQYGLDTKIEKFKFQYFDSDSINLTINGAETNCEQISVNPYENTRISGKGVIYYQGKSSNDNLKDKIIVVKNTTNIFQLLGSNTKAILSLGEADFTKVENSQDLTIDINMIGKKCDLTSSNIIGSISPVHHTNKEVIISAHWDSFKGSGASDNASGVGVLLELAKYYSSIKDTLPCIIRFVALGCEELGQIGSKAYVSKHIDELKNCILLFNIDQVGGNKDIYIEMKGGVSSENNKPIDSEILALQDYKGKWILNIPFSTYSNVPDWLKDSINQSCNELNYKFIPANGMGSDHQVFAQYGVCSTNICVSGDVKTHSPNDTPDKVSLDALRKSGEIVASIVNKSINR